MPASAPVACDRHHTTLRVPSLEEAVAFYVETLGFVADFEWGDPPALVGVRLGEVQLFLEVGTPGAEGCSLYFVVDDADLLWEFVTHQGASCGRPEDRAYGFRDFAVTDPNGYRLTFGHRIGSGEDAAAGAPVPVRRVEVTARLESRLAAVLGELAAHKSMTPGELLEEIVLHSFETSTRASPHSRADLRRISELKAAHGLDYPCHASYRFVEVQGDGG